MVACWTCLGEVDASGLIGWLADSAPSWPALECPTKPPRIHAPPAELVGPVVAQALALLGRGVAHRPMLSLARPGQSHPMHFDRQRSDWLTRIHVPLLTNPGAWMLFEEEGTAVHFAAGRAYTFDTLRRHSFGNDGPTGRVHLIFDVLEGA